jgi:hypothetical protein
MPRLFLFLFLAAQVVWPAPDAKAKENSKKSAPKQQSLTGCLDQQGETYVLRGLAAAGVLATLKGEAFPDDNFARYVGHKVTVHGSMQKEGESAVLRVTKVDDAGPGC